MGLIRLDKVWLEAINDVGWGMVLDRGCSPAGGYDHGTDRWLALLVLVAGAGSM